MRIISQKAYTFFIFLEASSVNTKIYVSTGSFTGNTYGNSHEHIAGILEKVNADGFEFLMVKRWYDKIDTVIRDFNRWGFNFPVFHMDKNIGEYISRNGDGDVALAAEIFERNCANACELGSKKLVLHLWGGLPSDKNINFNMEYFGKLNEKAMDYGFVLTVENVVCNTFDPMEHLRKLVLLYPHINFTIDTKFAAFHNQLAEYYASDNRYLWDSRHITHLHISDYKGGYMEWEKLRGLHPGQGTTDFSGLFQYMKKIDYDGTISLETTVNPSEDISLTNKSLEFIRKGLE